MMNEKSLLRLLFSNLNLKSDMLVLEAISSKIIVELLIIAVGVKSVLMIAVVFPVTVAANIALYYIYQRFICVKVYEKWAKERLRIN